MVPTKIKPMFNHIVVTMEREKEDKKIGEIIDITHKEGTIKDLQTVVSVGDTVKAIKPGDHVKINPTRYIRTRNSLRDELSNADLQVNVEFPVVNVGGVEYLFLYDSDIDYIVEEFGPDPTSNVYGAKSEIIS